MPAPAAIIPVILDTSAIPRQFSDAIIKAQRSVKPLNVRINPLPLGRINSDVLELNKSMDAATGRVIAFGATTSVVYGVGRAFSSLISSTLLVEKRLVAINSILNTSSSGLARLRDGLFKIANETATSFDEVSKAAEEFSRQGLSLNETIKRTKDAMLLMRLSGVSAEQAVSDLTAAVNTFKREALDTSSIVQKLATVDADFAVSQKDLAEAISRAGAAAQDAGVGFDELLGTVTALQQITARGGSNIGNALKSIFTRVNRAEVLDTLEGLGIEIESLPGKTRPAIELLTELAEKMKGLSDTRKSAIGEQIAGIYQINQFKSLIADLGQVNSLVKQASEVSKNASNEATSRAAQLNTSLTAIATQASNNITSLFSKVGDATIAPNLKNLLKQFNGLFREVESESGGDGIGSKIGKGILAGISGAISGPGAFVAFTLVLNSIKKIGGFAFEAVKDISGLNKASSQQQLLQGSINNLLATGNSYYLQRYRASNDETEQQKIILSLLRQQNAEIARQGSSSAGVSRALSGAFSGSESGKITPRKAFNGYIPNFGLNQAFNEEQIAINKNVGGARGATPKVLHNFNFGGGKRDSIVANTKEVIVENFAGGNGSAIFNPKMVERAGGLHNVRKLGKVKSLSNGYVPNFAPRFNPNIEIGDIIGSGSYKNVHSVKSIQGDLFSNKYGDDPEQLVAAILHTRNTKDFQKHQQFEKDGLPVPKFFGLEDVRAISRNGKFTKKQAGIIEKVNQLDGNALVEVARRYGRGTGRDAQDFVESNISSVLSNYFKEKGFIGGFKNSRSRSPNPVFGDLAVRNLGYKRSEPEYAAIDALTELSGFPRLDKRDTLGSGDINYIDNIMERSGLLVVDSGFLKPKKNAASGYVPNFAKTLLGRGAYGVFYDTGKTRNGLKIGVKEFPEGTKQEVEQEFRAAKVLEGILEKNPIFGGAVTSPKTIGTLKRSLNRFSIGKEVAEGVTFKQLSKDQDIKYGDSNSVAVETFFHKSRHAISEKLLGLGINPEDLNSGNIVVNSIAQNEISKLIGGDPEKLIDRLGKGGLDKKDKRIGKIIERIGKKGGKFSIVDPGLFNVNRGEAFKHQLELESTGAFRTANNGFIPNFAGGLKTNLLKPFREVIKKIQDKNYVHTDFNKSGDAQKLLGGASQASNSAGFYHPNSDRIFINNSGGDVDSQAKAGRHEAIHSILSRIPKTKSAIENRSLSLFRTDLDTSFYSDILGYSEKSLSNFYSDSELLEEVLAGHSEYDNRQPFSRYQDQERYAFGVSYKQQRTLDKLRDRLERGFKDSMTPQKSGNLGYIPNFAPNKDLQKAFTERFYKAKKGLQSGEEYGPMYSKESESLHLGSLVENALRIKSGALRSFSEDDKIGLREQNIKQYQNLRKRRNTNVFNGLKDLAYTPTTVRGSIDAIKDRSPDDVTRRQLLRLTREFDLGISSDPVNASGVNKRDEVAVQIKNLRKIIAGKKQDYDVNGRGYGNFPDLIPRRIETLQALRKHGAKLPKESPTSDFLFRGVGEDEITSLKSLGQTTSLGKSNADHLLGSFITSSFGKAAGFGLGAAKGDNLGFSLVLDKKRIQSRGTTLAGKSGQDYYENGKLIQEGIGRAFPSERENTLKAGRIEKDDVLGIIDLKTRQIRSLDEFSAKNNESKTKKIPLSAIRKEFEYERGRYGYRDTPSTIAQDIIKGHKANLANANEMLDSETDNFGVPLTKKEIKFWQATKKIANIALADTQQIEDRAQSIFSGLRSDLRAKVTIAANRASRGIFDQNINKNIIRSTLRKTDRDILTTSTDSDSYSRGYIPNFAKVFRGYSKNRYNTNGIYGNRNPESIEYGKGQLSELNKRYPDSLFYGAKTAGHIPGVTYSTSLSKDIARQFAANDKYVVSGNLRVLSDRGNERLRQKFVKRGGSGTYNDFLLNIASKKPFGVARNSYEHEKEIRAVDPNMLVRFNSANLGYIPNFASGLKSAILREKKATGENPKVGYDSRVGVGVFAPSQGTLSNAINQHLQGEPGRNLSNLKETGSAKIPNFAPTPAEAAIGLDRVSKSLERFTKQQIRLQEEQERGLLTSKAISEEGLKGAERGRLNYLNAQKIARDSGTSVEELKEFKKANPAAYKASGVNETVFNAANKATASVLKEALQEGLVRQFANDKISKVGSFGNTDKVRDSFLRANASTLDVKTIEQIKDIASSRKAENASSLQNKLFGASFAIPFITDAVTTFLAKAETQSGRFASSAGQGAGTALSIGTLIGQVGGGKAGLITGGLSALVSGAKAVSNSASPDISQLQKTNSDIIGAINERENQTNAVINAIVERKQVQEGGGNALALERATKALDEAFAGIGNLEDRKALDTLNSKNGGPSYDDISDFRSNRGQPGKREKRAVGAATRIAEITDGLDSSESIFSNLGLGNRRSLIAGLQNTNNSALDGGVRNIFSAFTGQGATIKNARAGFGNLNKDEYNRVKEEVLGTFSTLDSSKLNIESIKKSKNNGADSVSIIEQSFGLAGLDVESKKKEIDALLTTSLTDSSKILDDLIVFLESNKTSLEKRKAADDIEKKNIKLNKITKEGISAVDFGIRNGINNFSNKSNFAIAGVRGAIDNSSLTASGRINAEAGVNALSIKQDYVGGVSEIVASSIEKVKDELVKNSDKLNDITVRKQVAGSLLNINNNPFSAPQEYEKLANLLEKSQASEDSQNNVRNAGLDIGNQLFFKKQDFDAKNAANGQNRQILLEGEKKQRNLGFLGGDFQTVKNNKAGEFYDGLASLNTPLVKNRNKRFQDSSNASILGDQASLYEKLFKEGIISPDSKLAGIGRNKIEQAAEVNSRSTLDDLSANTKDKDIKAAIEEQKKRLPEIAKTIANDRIGSNSDKDVNNKLATAQSQFDVSKLQIDALVKQTDALGKNTSALQKLAGIFGEPSVEPAPSKAKGFIPNFSAYSSELNAIKNGVGGARLGDRPVVRNVSGLGRSVLNTGEKLVRNFLGSNKDAVFNRDMIGSLGDPSNFGSVENLAGGYIPNFASVRGLFGDDVASRANISSKAGNLIYFIDSDEKGYTKNGVKYMTAGDLSRGEKIPANARVLSFNGSYDANFARSAGSDSAVSKIGFGRNNVRPIGPRILPPKFGDKLFEAQNTKFIAKSVEFQDILDKAKRGAGRSARVIVEGNSQLGGHFLLKDKFGAQSAGLKASFPQPHNPVLNDFRPAISDPKRYFAQAYSLSDTRSVQGAANEYRVHGAIDSSGKSRIAYGGTLDKADPHRALKSGDKFASAAEKLARRTLQDFAKNTGVTRGAFGLDIGRVDPEFAKAENKRLGFKRFQITGFGKNKVAFGVFELNPTERLSGQGSGYSQAIPGVTENIARSTRGQLPTGVSAPRFIFDALKNRDSGKLGDIAGPAYDKVKEGGRRIINGVGGAIKSGVSKIGEYIDKKSSPPKLPFLQESADKAADKIANEKASAQYQKEYTKYYGDRSTSGYAQSKPSFISRVGSSIKSGVNKLGRGLGKIGSSISGDFKRFGAYADKITGKNISGSFRDSLNYTKSSLIYGVPETAKSILNSAIRNTGGLVKGALGYKANATLFGAGTGFFGKGKAFIGGAAKGIVKGAGYGLAGEFAKTFTDNDRIKSGIDIAVAQRAGFLNLPGALLAGIGAGIFTHDSVSKYKPDYIKESDGTRLGDITTGIGNAIRGAGNFLDPRTQGENTDAYNDATDRAEEDYKRGDVNFLSKAVLGAGSFIANKIVGGDDDAGGRVFRKTAFQKPTQLFAGLTSIYNKGAKKLGSAAFGDENLLTFGDTENPLESTFRKDVSAPEVAPNVTLNPESATVTKDKPISKAQAYINSLDKDLNELSNTGLDSNYRNELFKASKASLNGIQRGIANAEKTGKGDAESIAIYKDYLSKYGEKQKGLQAKLDGENKGHLEGIGYQNFSPGDRGVIRGSTGGTDEEILKDYGAEILNARNSYKEKFGNDVNAGERIFGSRPVKSSVETPVKPQPLSINANLQDRDRSVFGFEAGAANNTILNNKPENLAGLNIDNGLKSYNPYSFPVETEEEKKKRLDKNFGQEAGPFAKGHIPNFAKSIIKRFGKLGALKNIIDSKDDKEAKEYIRNGGLPQSFINNGYNERDLDAISSAIQREKDALYSRGISRNLASGYIFAGYHPKIGIGIGNTLDEPAGRYNTTAGLSQGINRVTSQGGNPNYAGVPNYAASTDSTSESLIAVIERLIASLDQKSGESAGTGGASEVKVDHNISVNASINGVIESNNNAVKDEVQKALDELKTRLAALESAQKTGKYTPPPPSQKVTV